MLRGLRLLSERLLRWLPARARVFDRHGRGLLVAVGLSLVPASCIYDPDHRCGPNQHLGANSTCLCDDGLVSQGQSCVPCGENEVWAAGVCTCAEGFSRGPGADAACEPGGPGASCDPSAATTGCEDTAFSTCRDRGGGVGYCTSACESDMDCLRGFVCDTTSEPASCKMAAVGEGDACTTAEDCADNDATYCETALVHVCLVPGCSVDNVLSCSEGWRCCDVRALGLNMTLCTPEGQCPTDP